MKHVSMKPVLAVTFVALGCGLPAHTTFAQTKAETASVAQIRALQKEYVA